MVAACFTQVLLQQKIVKNFQIHAKVLFDLEADLQRMQNGISLLTSSIVKTQNEFLIYNQREPKYKIAFNISDLQNSQSITSWYFDDS